MQTFEDAVKDLVDRSLMIRVVQCVLCGDYFARVVYPKTAKLDRLCDEQDHCRETGHCSFTAIKLLIVYMSQTDKDLASALDKVQRKQLDELMRRREH